MKAFEENLLVGCGSEATRRGLLYFRGCNETLVAVSSGSPSTQVSGISNNLETDERFAAHKYESNFDVLCLQKAALNSDGARKVLGEILEVLMLTLT